MNLIRRRSLLMLCLAPGLASSHQPALRTAERGWEPLEALPFLARALRGLGTDAPRHLLPEPGENAPHSLDRLINSLAKLQMDLQLLHAHLPDDLPSPRALEQLDLLGRDMIESVYQTGTAIEAFVKDAAWASGSPMRPRLTEIAFILTFGRRARSFNLSWLQINLGRSSRQDKVWPADTMRQLLRRSLAALEAGLENARTLSGG